MLYDSNWRGTNAQSKFEAEVGLARARRGVGFFRKEMFLEALLFNRSQAAL